MLLALAACGNGQKPPASSVEQPDAVVKPAPFNEEAAREILDTPMDGSALETFTQDLQRVKDTASPEDYYLLKSALDALLFYDLSAAGDTARLYQSLDGMTPNEIIASAKR
jgi:hypothetical protein